MINNLNFTLDFIENTPKSIREIILNEKLNITSKLERYQLYTIENQPANWNNLMFQVLDDIEIEINSNIKNIKIEIQNNDKLKEYYSSLNSVGCTNNSLSLKGSIFTNLWNNFIDAMNNSFNIENILIKMKEALDYLTNLYSSLKIVFPFLEKMKEYIDIILGAIGLIKQL